MTTDMERFEAGGDLLDIIELTALFGEPGHQQGAVAAWTGDTCYSTSGEPLPVWTVEHAAILAAAWREDAARVAALDLGGE